MSTAHIQFVLAQKPVGSKPFLYLACYDSKGNYYSSNYYNTTPRDPSSGNLTVTNGCYIYGIYADQNRGVFYTITPMYVSTVDILPVGVINVLVTETIGDNVTTYDLSSVSTSTVMLGLTFDVTGKVTTINNSDDATSCGSNVIIGDAAVTMVTRTNGAYYTNHNICVSSSIMTKYMSYYGRSVNWLLVIVIILILLVSLSTAIYFIYHGYKKHKMN